MKYFGKKFTLTLSIILSFITVGLYPATAASDTFRATSRIELYKLPILIAKKTEIDIVCKLSTPEAREKCTQLISKDEKPIVLNRSLLAYVAASELALVAKAVVADTEALMLQNKGKAKGRITPGNLEFASKDMIRSSNVKSVFDKRSSIATLAITLEAKGEPTLRQSLQIGIKDNKVLIYGKDIFKRDFNKVS